MRILHIQDSTGDTQVDLDKKSDLAQDLFSKAISDGGLAYMYVDGQETAVSVRDFAETSIATKVIVTPRYVGG